MSLPEPLPSIVDLDGPPVEVDDELEYLVGRSLAEEVNQHVRWTDAERDARHQVAVITGFIEQPEHGRSRWAIESDDDAEWAMARLAEVEGQLEDIARKRDAYIDKAHRWYWRLAPPLLRRQALFRAHLGRWGLARRAAAQEEARLSRRKTWPKTFHVPSGHVSTRGGGDPVVQIADAETLVAWAREHCPQAVTTTYTVKITDLRPHVEIVAADDTDDGPEVVVQRWVEAGTGEVTLGDPADPVPGVTVEHPAINPTVKPSLPLE